MRRRPSGPAQSPTAPPLVHEVLGSPGQPLDAWARADMEVRLAHDLSRVRVHHDTKAAASARSVNAVAYTVGQHVVFDQGMYRPATHEGRRLLAHELVHTLQNSSSPDPVPGGTIRVGEADHESERSADAISQHALRRSYLRPVLTAPSVPGTNSAMMLKRTCRDHPDETFYRTAPNYCKDTGFSGSLHPGQQCYREVPRRSSYWQCPPGDQVCFDANGACHDSWDRASTVESKEPGTGACNLHGWCFLQHAVLDIVPPVLEDVGRAQLNCIETCRTLPWYSRGLCLQGCSGSMM